MDEDGSLADVHHGRVVDEVEPGVVVLADVVDGEEGGLAVLVALSGQLDVALHVDIDGAAALRLDDVGVEALVVGGRGRGLLVLAVGRHLDLLVDESGTC